MSESDVCVRVSVLLKGYGEATTEQVIYDEAGELLTAGVSVLNVLSVCALRLHCLCRCGQVCVRVRVFVAMYMCVLPLL